jgi:DNA-binding transcriptional ArsR family regulator
MIAPVAATSRDPSQVFLALADPTRRKMIEQLSVLGPVTISQLTEVFPITRQAVTKHLDTLSEAGLVATERRGRERIVTFRPEPLHEAIDWVAAIEARWDRRLAALANFLAAEATATESSAPSETKEDPQ